MERSTRSEESSILRVGGERYTLSGWAHERVSIQLGGVSLERVGSWDGVREKKSRAKIWK